MSSGVGMATVNGGMEFPMGGVTVKFPYKPYPPQKAMMSKVLGGQNTGGASIVGFT